MSDVHAEYDPHTKKFYRTFNMRYTLDGEEYEVQVKAASWAHAEAHLFALQFTGVVHSELIAVYPTSTAVARGGS